MASINFVTKIFKAVTKFSCLVANWDYRLFFFDSSPESAWHKETLDTKEQRAWRNDDTEEQWERHVMLQILGQSCMMQKPFAISEGTSVKYN